MEFLVVLVTLGVVIWALSRPKSKRSDRSGGGGTSGGWFGDSDGGGGDGGGGD